LRLARCNMFEGGFAASSGIFALFAAFARIILADVDYSHKGLAFSLRSI
jgi:hypothetical protein